jgi:hypothetical protein
MPGLTRRNEGNCRGCRKPAARQRGSKRQGRMEGGEWERRSFATNKVAGCACRVDATGPCHCARMARGMRHRHKVTIQAINNHMLASIRWQIVPWWGASASLGDSVSVFQSVSPPAGAQAIAGIWPAICVGDTRWHRPACARMVVVWTKLQANQPLTQQRAGETHYRGQTALQPRPGFHPPFCQVGGGR